MSTTASFEAVKEELSDEEYRRFRRAMIWTAGYVTFWTLFLAAGFVMEFATTRVMYAVIAAQFAGAFAIPYALFFHRRLERWLAERR